jgi:hypothetical protein
VQRDGRRHRRPRRLGQQETDGPAGDFAIIASVTDSLGLNIQVPHPARVYDFWLGGKDNFEADRRAAAEAIEIFPKTVQSARSCRDFLSRVVSYLTAEAGIRQFLDLGSGLPSAANVHEVAQSIAPESRVVYVDNDRFKSGCVHALG